MASFVTLITNLGQAKIAAALANGTTVNISEMAIGDGMGNPITPDITQTALVREVYRAQLNSLTRDSANPNYIIAELIVPSTVGGWTVREFGLFDNAGALIAVGNYPDSYKPTLDENSARDMIVRVIIEISNEANVTIEIDPSVVLASRQWVGDNYSLKALLPGGYSGDILRKKTNSDGDVEWYDLADGVNIIIKVIEETQELVASQAVVTLGKLTTGSTAFYLNGIRLREDQYTIDSPTQLTLHTPATGTGYLTAFQNEPAGNADFLSTQLNLSDIPDKAAARTNLGVDTPANTTLAVLQYLYPVGEIYCTRRNGNPGPIGTDPGLLGFGTWQRYAPGRVLASLDPNDSNFNAVDLEAGEKSHVLTSAELPSHVHTVDPPATATGGQSIDHTHSYGTVNTRTSASDGGKTNPGPPTTGTTGGASNDHTHIVDIPQFNSGAVGSNNAHNNLPPYKVVNVWLRTA
ncbi:MAG: phage tail protein [Chthoniobacteraceae bacterium]